MKKKLDTSAREDLGDDFKKALDDRWLPIREVARQTGVNAVTLRAWERRYGLIVPLRTPKGHRLFSADHVQRIQAILTWLNRGVAVSQVKPLLDTPQASRVRRQQHNALLQTLPQAVSCKRALTTASIRQWRCIRHEPCASARCPAGALSNAGKASSGADGRAFLPGCAASSVRAHLP
jgi:DNA-binding transcriptional MerR regulator